MHNQQQQQGPPQLVRAVNWILVKH
jgi:hypothetical protein